MISLILAAILTASAAEPTTLDAHDQGLYMLVHRDGHLVKNQINKLQLDGTQWNLYKRQPDGSWESVTCEEACLLKESTPDEIGSFTAGTEIFGADLACVHDTAFAFCRETKQDKTRAYYLVAFVNGGSVPIKYARLNPETLEPESAP